MNLTFNQKQSSAVASALTMLAVAILLAGILTVFSGFMWFMNRFASVIYPLITAGIMALVLKPYYQWVLRYTGRKAWLAAVLVIMSVLLPFVAFMWFFGSILVEQFVGLMTHLPGLIDRLQVCVREKYPEVMAYLQQTDAISNIKSFLQAKSGWLAGALQSAGKQAWTAGLSVFNMVTSLLAWAVFPVYFGFFLMANVPRHDQLEKYLPFLKSKTRSDVIYLAEHFVNIVVAFFRGQLLIALLQGLLFAGGFMLAGLQYGFVIGLTLGFLNIVPYLGNLIGLATALPLAYFQQDGGWPTLAMVVAVFGVVQSIEGYILTPRIMGNKTGLHPVVIIIAMFFWGSAFSGIMGMILAVPLTGFLVVFWRLAKEKYIHEWM